MEVTREQMREFDRRAIEDFGIPGIILMENAGRAVASEVWSLTGIQSDARVAILCGKGNNGGDGYVVARHLYNRGMDPTVLVFSQLGKVSGDAGTNLAIIRKMGLAIEEIADEAALGAVETTLTNSHVLVLR